MYMLWHCAGCLNIYKWMSSTSQLFIISSSLQTLTGTFESRNLGFLILFGRGLYIFNWSNYLCKCLDKGLQNWPKITHLRLLSCRDDLVIKAGSEAGAMLVDGLGDGVMLEAPTQDFDFLRTTSFNMLQGCRMRNTKTVCSCTFWRIFQKLSNQGVKLMYFVWRIGHVQIQWSAHTYHLPTLIVLQLTEWQWERCHLALGAKSQRPL